MPAWDLVDLDAYAEFWRARHGYWEMNVWTARGCPYRCNWCAKPTWGRSYHVRSPHGVVEELAALQRAYRPDRVWFTDDIFALRPAWLRELRGLLDLHPEAHTPYRCLSRVDLMRDPSFTEDLAATGCREVWVGAESGADSVLRAMDKESSIDDIETATTLLRRAGIRVGFFLQLGYPGEDKSDVLKTIRMVRRLRPEEIGVSVSYPLPNTRFQQIVAGAMKKAHWTTSMDNETLFEAPYGDGFYRAAKQVLRSEHSLYRAPQTVRAFLHQPDARAARRIAGAMWHAARLPLMHAWMQAAARPNPNAVTLPSAG